jgi:hypothetical protein
MKSITTAIENLPAGLITPEIVTAALQEGKIELLNYLPEKYLTEENINALVENDKSYWGHFDLKKIPLSCRNQAVCDCAVEKFTDNYLYVPEQLKTVEMLDGLMDNVHNNFGRFKYVPSSHWTHSAVYKGFKRLYNEDGYNRSYGRSYSYNRNTDKSLKMVQVLLSSVPSWILDRQFYHGLFRLETLPAKDIVFLTPSKHRDENFYLLLACRDFSLVPANRYSYEIFRTALSGKGNLSPSDIFDKQPLRDAVLPMMDDAMADAIVKRGVQYFEKLPAVLQTADRLQFTVENNPDYHYWDSLVKDNSLLTESVCKVLVKTNANLPELPESVWRESFVAFCMENSKSFRWFAQMPQRLQTQEIVNASTNYWPYYVQYAHPAFINSHLAMQLFRKKNDVKKYLPQKYFTEFVETTGLPEEFFGGETTFMKLKDERENYTWSQIGNSYIGFYKKSDYSNSVSFVIMTRASSGSGQPEVVFNRRVGSFHKSWLEKMIADYDREFVKPTVGKALKEMQPNLYCSVEPAGTKDGIEIFKTFFMGEQTGYAGRKNGLVFHGETRDEVIALFNTKEAE